MLSLISEQLCLIENNQFEAKENQEELKALLVRILRKGL